MENARHKSDDINYYIPSLLNQRSVRKNYDQNNLSQLSTTSRFSLSLRKPHRKVLGDIYNTQDSIRTSNNASDYKDRNRSKENMSIMPSTSKLNLNNDNEFLNFSDILSIDKTNSILNVSSSNVLRVRSIIESSSNKISKNENREDVSIHSCTTQLYNQSECSPQSHRSDKNSVITISSGEHLILNIEQTPKGHKVTKRPADDNESCMKKKKSNVDNSCVLILNKTAVNEYSKIVVEPPNIKLVKRHKSNVEKGKFSNLKQKITDYFRKKVRKESIADAVVSDDVRLVTGERENRIALDKHDETNKAAKARHASGKRAVGSPHRAASNRGERAASASMAFTISTRSVPKPTSPSTLPPHKIIQGTHFAVDAFCYGAIPNVKVYFLTHFHSDHYMGLRKSFTNTIYCSKITGDLCILRLGINPKCIKYINPGDKVVVEGIEVIAVDANHCPGSIMLVFGLRNGTNILHCGDFRANHQMESYPVFWNKDIQTIYLDTTYCNPRYNFPTQDESIAMAAGILHRKRADMKKKHRNFAKVLIVCGAYTIGKENFFIRLSEQLECSVWAGPEKDAILRTALGRSFAGKPPQHCQIHVLDMRLITHKDLKAYLESMGGAFNEVVALKPSGWENAGKPPFQADNISIYGIPYSEHSSFNELLRFVTFLQPKLVIPTVPIVGGIKSVQKYFPCPLSNKEMTPTQRRLSDYVTSNRRTVTPPVT